VPDEKPPVEKAVELLVYAPVGMALYVRDMLPSMVGIFVARGKREVAAHRMPPAPPVAPPPIPPEVKRRIDESVGMARVMAEGGFGVAREVAGSGIGVARDVAGSALTQFLARRGTNGDAMVDDAPPAAPERPGPAPAAPATSTPAPAPAPARAAEPPVPPDAAWKADGFAEKAALPIPDYDELSASQVVERLEGLDHESLEAIRRYETDHRGRNTILGKIAQLT
jgi:hypothetical protein